MSMVLLENHFTGVDDADVARRRPMVGEEHLNDQRFPPATKIGGAAASLRRSGRIFTDRSGRGRPNGLRCAAAACSHGKPANADTCARQACCWYANLLQTAPS